MNRICVFVALAVLMSTAAIKCVAENCNSQKPWDVFTKCTAETQLCDGTSCADSNTCDGYYELPFTWIEPDIRKNRTNEDAKSRACTTGDPTTICRWDVEDCYTMKVCYLVTVGPNHCAFGQECEGPFIVDYTSGGSDCVPEGSL